uniref:PDZ and LIM domain protein Zasp n=1 Tax=Arion vulgaris TaxID=1028688 RepID=A0A0B7ADR3_9EUPU
MSVLTLEAKLERTDSSTPWGFRMQGGKDFSSPLTIQNVNPGSLAAKCGLQTGDIILKIGTSDTKLLKHKEAQTSILDCGNRLDLLLQRGGTAGSDRFNGPEINTSNSWNSQPQTISPAGQTSQQSFNSAPRPFGSQAPARSNYEPILSQQTSNLSLSSQPKEVLDFQSVGEKYADKDEATDPSQHQSKSFKYLANLMDEGRELNSALKPRVGSSTSKAPPITKPTPPPEPVHPPAATPIGPGSKPGTVKALVSQRYNNPIGLYSNDNVNTQLEGQSKFLVDGDETPGSRIPPDFPPPPPPPPTNHSEYDEHGRKRYIPSETFRMVQEDVGLLSNEDEPGPTHSRTFKILQQQLDSGGTAPPPAPAYKPASTPAFQPARTPVATATSAKPWAPPPAPVSNTTARPFGSTAPPVPTGVGATRGKKGDAAMNPAMLPAAGRIPVCSGCNMPVRGPFVTALGKCWCPDHFICANPQCGTKLLDIGFVEEGGQLYCERDYAIHFAPHCDRCGQAVIGECVNAMQKSFHPHCFLCAQCHKPIGGTKFHIEDGKYYCEADWAAMFQTICAGCDFPIEPGDRWVEALGRNFHSECFNCAKCQVNLEGQQFCAKGGKAYCKNHAR